MLRRNLRLSTNVKCMVSWLPYIEATKFQNLINFNMENKTSKTEQPCTIHSVGRSLSQRFADEVWNVLKPKGYKRNGNNFIYTGKEVKTVVNIQGGKYSQKDDAYSMLNISYGRMDKKVKSIRDCDFFIFRHDSYDENGFFGMGSGYGNIYPVSLDYTNDVEISKAIDILKKIEPLFRCETFKDIEDKYKMEMTMGNCNCWDDVYGMMLS
jgi:hypothetical protein